MKTDAPPLGSRSRKIRLKDNLGLTASLIRNALINYLAGLPRPVLDYDPIRFVSQEDILQACLPANTARPDGLGAHHSCLAQATETVTLEPYSCATIRFLATPPPRLPPRKRLRGLALRASAMYRALRNESAGPNSRSVIKPFRGFAPATAISELGVLSSRPAQSENSD